MSIYRLNAIELITRIFLSVFLVRFSYPGAIMIMFKTTTGRVEIHGNYMHTSAELEENSTIWNNAHIDALVIHNNPTWVC